MIKECIDSRIEHILGSIDATSRVSPETEKMGNMSVQLEYDFQIVHKKTQKLDDFKTYFINSFQAIGWPDPFPDEHTMAIHDQNQETEFLRDPEDLVYHESRYSEEYSPLVIYMPSKMVLVKLMRACMACDDPSDLWINRLNF